MRSFTKSIFIIFVSSVLLLGCGGATRYRPAKERDYRITYRRFAPEAVYNRLRWSQLPEPIPVVRTVSKEVPYILPIFEFNIKNESVEEAVRMLAGITGYNAYTESTVADKKVTIQMVGTLDEVAVKIASAVDAKVVVDHDGRIIRVFGVGAEVPRFSDEVINEHKSNN